MKLVLSFIILTGILWNTVITTESTEPINPSSINSISSTSTSCRIKKETASSPSSTTSTSSSSFLRGSTKDTTSSENTKFNDELQRILQSTDKPITYPTYAEAVIDMHNLAAQYPDLIQLWNAQDRYGVPSPRSSCRVDTANTLGPCKHWFLTITNHTTLQDTSLTNSVNQRDRPQIFFSGNLHGDEKVGPITLFTLMHLLVETTQESSPNYNPWLRHLLNTRIIVMIPMTNPLGYDHHVRGEDGVDPNRDFPYAELPENCMVTATARALNEVWREHLFQLAITFHGGMQAISYEWGSPNHENNFSESPDDIAQVYLTKIMREMAGKYLNNAYPIGRMNQLVYPVSGGMEDWAYAGSWDTSAVTICKPSTFGGYPAEKMRYNTAQLRAVNVLVEAWDDKTPALNQLGLSNPESMLLVEGRGDGHGPRNVRLALSLLDLVQPYVQVTKKLGYVHTGTSKHSATIVSLNTPPTNTNYGIGHPGLCIPSNITAALQGKSINDIMNNVNDCGMYKQQYDTWNTVYTELSIINNNTTDPTIMTITETDAESSFWLGWDVGGSVNVDLTTALIAAWDPRVPPEVFSRVRPVISSSGQLGEVTMIEPNSFIPDENFVASLIGTYGFTSRPEAESFAVKLHYLQLFTNGRIPLMTIPNDFYLRANKEILSGTTRWSFGQVGPVTNPILSPEERDPNAPISPIKDSPDLVYNPFVTRFSHCFRLSTSGITATLDGLTSSSIYDCHHDDMDTSGNTKRNLQNNNNNEEIPRTLTDTIINPSSFPSEFQTAVRSFIILPYAQVDKDFKRQNNPEPANVPPQTHWVNARTNPQWNMENNLYRVQGKHQFVGKPVFVGVETRSSWDLASLTPHDSGSSITATPSPTRIPHISHTPAPVDTTGNTQQFTDTQPKATPINGLEAFLIALAVTCIIGGCLICIQFIRIRYLERKAERIEDEILRSSMNRQVFSRSANNTNNSRSSSATVNFPTTTTKSVSVNSKPKSVLSTKQQRWKPQIDIEDDDENTVTHADIAIADDDDEENLSQITPAKNKKGQSV